MRKAKAIVASYVGVLAFASLVFIGAGRLAYWQGALYLALALLGATLGHILTPAGSDLADNRVKDATAGQNWDTRLLVAMAVLNVITFLVAGADSGRFGWSGSVPMTVTIAGVTLMLAGQTVFAVAKRQNSFFTSTVRIQAERGHSVCDSGLYGFVRHPGYLGMLLLLVSFPLVMGSYWALIPTLLGVALLVVRTSLEDRFLARELAGYSEYASRIRWRMVPGVF